MDEFVARNADLKRSINGIYRILFVAYILDLYPPSFSSTGSTLKLSKFLHFFFRKNNCISFCSSEIFISFDVSRFLAYFSQGPNYHCKFCCIKLCNKWRHTVNFRKMKVTKSQSSHPFVRNICGATSMYF